MSKSIFKNVWFYLAILVFVVIVYAAFPKVSAGQYDTFAKCLNESGLIMYGTEWCPHCKNQKALFGSSFEFVNYIDCDANKAECDKNAITGFPTWKFEGEKFEGVQSLEKMGAITGCELVKDN